jgi:hypothetical protein
MSDKDLPGNLRDLPTMPFCVTPRILENGLTIEMTVEPIRPFSTASHPVLMLCR